IIINVSQSQALQNDPKGFKSQIGDYKNQLESNHGDLINKVQDKAKDLNTEENRNFLMKIWDAIVEFIQNIVNAIKGLFN
ncbi:hypothetical protein QP374_32025, partial [Pseudomonas aeruginosa]|uniref:hypothetical protein n=1 Tax=Pseudomonas aeruginosa TaxID=287 RepID=UPI0025572EB6